MFGNVFGRRESKCCGALIKHRRKVKVNHSRNGSAIIITSMLYQDNYFVVSVKLNLETEIDCIDDEGKGQSVTDTDDEFTECQTPSKTLQSIAI